MRKTIAGLAVVLAALTGCTPTGGKVVHREIVVVQGNQYPTLTIKGTTGKADVTVSQDVYDACHVGDDYPSCGRS
jgi:hypothetical protein